MIPDLVWTPDRIAAAAGGVVMCLFLYFYFFGKRRAVSARAGPAGAQQVTVVVSGGYKPDVVVAKKGAPLKIVFDRREDSPCSDEVLLPEFKVRRSLPAHQKTVIEVLPRRVGEFPFSCGMNMLHGKIRVVE